MQHSVRGSGKTASNPPVRDSLNVKRPVDVKAAHQKTKTSKNRSKFRERALGSTAVFLLPSLKLKEPALKGPSVENRLHAFLMDNFGGYTAQAGNIFGYWRSGSAPDSYGEHREFSVALGDNAKLPLLKQFLAATAGELKEECLLLRAGDKSWLIYSATG
jgi:hypothetical protein